MEVANSNKKLKGYRGRPMYQYFGKNILYSNSLFHENVITLKNAL